MTKTRWAIAIAITVAVTLLALGSLKPRAPSATVVSTTVVSARSLVRYVTARGKLEPTSRVTVSSNVSGTLVELEVGIGSHVKIGDRIGRVDPSRLEAQLAQQRAAATGAAASVRREDVNLERQRKEIARLEQLAAKHAIGPAELEAARDVLRGAEAQRDATRSQSAAATAALREASTTLAQATLTAPMEGTVIAVGHRVGERVRGSDLNEDMIVSIAAVERMDVRVEVGEADVVLVQPGQSATIEIDALPGEKVAAKVLARGRDAIVRNAGSFTEVAVYPVWLRLERTPPAALSGMSAHVTIEADRREQALSVPIQAVAMRAPSTGASASPTEGAAAPAVPAALVLERVVFVVPGPEGGPASRRVVKTGMSSDSHLEILEGLAAGEHVIDGPYRIVARELEEGTLTTSRADATP